MFTAGEMQLIRKNCPKDFESLLRSLSISNPDFASGDEYRIYEKLDNELEKKIGRLMKSPSAVEGYTKLLNLGGVAYNYSELDNELLAKVVANKDSPAAKYNSTSAATEEDKKNRTAHRG